MPYPETSIWAALRARIDTLVTSPVMVVYDPDSPVSPQSSGGNPVPFILASDVRNDNVRTRISNDKPIRSGTLMLAVNWPIAVPISHMQLMQIGGAIADHFPSDMRLRYDNACVRITVAPDVAQPYRQDAWKVLIVRVPWANT